MRGSSERREREPIDLLALVSYSYDSAPNPRFRMEQWAPALAELGVRVSFLNFSDDALDRARRAGDSLSLMRGAARRYPSWFAELLERSARADAILVSIKAAIAGPPIGEAALRALGRPFIYDVDDAHHVTNVNSVNWKDSALRCDWRVPYLGRWASMVTAGNTHLASYYRGLNEHVRVWPTTVTMARYTERLPPSKDAPLIVGWTGSPSTAHYLAELLPELAALQRSIPFRLYVFGASIDLGGVDGWCEPWSREREVEAVHQMDIGLMPLTDDPWARGKCGFKAIQYQAVGIPAIVSDVGVNSEIVSHEETGLVVPGGSEWTGPLRRLLEDAALRKSMGAAGRARITAHYSTEAQAPIMARDIHEYVGRVKA